MAASNLNIAGFNVPINTLLKKAAGEQTNPIGHEDKVLREHLVVLQKWFVYWIVYAAIHTVESVIPLHYLLPGYSFFRFLLSGWLVLPIFLSFRTEAGGEDVTAKEWNSFSGQGCGLVYYQYLRPWLEGELSILANLPINVSAIQNFVLNNLSSLSFLLKYLNVDGSKAGAGGESSYLGSVKSYLFATTPAAGPEGSRDDVVEAEYDVIDKPEQPGVTQRKVSGDSRKWLW